MAKGELQVEREQPGDAVRTFAEAGGIAEKAQNQDLVRRAEVGRAWALHLSGDHRGASIVLNEARRYYEDHRPDSPELAVVLYRLARARQARGDLEAGRQAAQEALELARVLDDRRAVAGTYWDAALLEEQRRDFARATEYALRARDILADLGERRDGARLLEELGEIMNCMGRPQDAIGYFEEALGLLANGGDRTPAAVGLLNGLATAWLSMGETRSSLEYAAQSLALLEGQEDLGASAGRCHLLRGRAFLADGRLRECRDELETAKRCTEGGEPRHSLSGCLLLEGDLLLAEGRPEQAAAAFRRSSELAQDVRG